MPILSELSRRFHMLTTDAKPDPPRVPIEEHTHNFPSNEKTEKKSKSLSGTPVAEFGQDDVRTIHREKSVPNDAIPTTAEYSEKEKGFGDSGPSESREQKKPTATRVKSKSKQFRNTQAANVVNYNIINSNGVKIGARTSYICNVNQYPSNTAPTAEEACPKTKFRQMPIHVESLTHSTKEITLDDIFLLKTHIGRGWRDLARRLSYSDGQIEQFEENYRQRGIDEVIYQLLLDWKQANTKDAAVGVLLRELWSCQEYDCAERLVALRKDIS